MSLMLSREGHVTCQNEHHRRRVGNLELEFNLEILKCQPIKTSNGPACSEIETFGTAAAKSKTLAAHEIIQSHGLRKLRKCAKGCKIQYVLQ